MGRKKKEELFREPRKNRVVILEDADFVWDRPELKKMATMWERGTSLERIANHFNRDKDEVFLALLHLAREGKVSTRINGLKGEN